MAIGTATGRVCALAVAFWASSACADYAFTCGSEGGHHRTCLLREPGNVRLVRQISGARCELGRSWGFDDRELWVDHGCEAEFVVEVPRGGYRHPRDEAPYGDPNAYAPPPPPPPPPPPSAPYLPPWMVGTFQGFDPRYRVPVTITVRPDGRTTSDVGGRMFEGYVSEERLHIGDFTFDLDQTREGFTTSQKGDREYVVRYRRLD